MEDCFGERLKAWGRTVETPLRSDETSRFFGAGRRTLHGLLRLKRLASRPKSNNKHRDDRGNILTLAEPPHNKVLLFTLSLSPAGPSAERWAELPLIMKGVLFCPKTGDRKIPSPAAIEIGNGEQKTTGG